VTEKSPLESTFGIGADGLSSRSLYAINMRLQPIVSGLLDRLDAEGSTEAA
jgi:hypothetical protein